FSYNSFLPEFNKLQTKRSKVHMEKIGSSLFFKISCSDITAFRATVSDIIGLGKIISNTIELCNK
ncbi:MAG: KEOPS complex subunit Pcc1, partial [Promethearchaeota archaeon]